MGWGGAFIALLVLAVIGGLAFFFGRWILKIALGILVPTARLAKKTLDERAASAAPAFDTGAPLLMPTEIRWFERVMFAMTGLLAVAGWDVWLQLAGFGGGVFLLIPLMSFAITIGLTLAISRRRSSVALWLFGGLLMFNLPGMVKLISKVPLTLTLPYVGMAMAYGLLFTPASRRWFKAARHLT